MPDRLQPPLSVLRAFEATVRNGSMKQAAKELHVTDGAISRAVRALETDLGVTLFERSNRLVVPTHAARALADDLRAGLDQIGRSLKQARRVGGPDLPVVLSCEPTFLIRWLIPRLGSLQKAIGGERELRFVSAGGPVAFVRDGIDLAIRRADFPLGTDVLAEAFLDEHIGPVCKPRSPASSNLREQDGAPLLHTTTRRDAWRTWPKISGVKLKPSREVTFEHFYQSLQAAVAGAGLAIGPAALVADDLRSGALVAPWGFVRDGSSYVLMRSLEKSEDKLFGKVLAWLRREAVEIEKIIAEAGAKASKAVKD